MAGTKTMKAGGDGTGGDDNTESGNAAAEADAAGDTILDEPGDAPDQHGAQPTLLSAQSTLDPDPMDAPRPVGGTQLLDPLQPGQPAPAGPPQQAHAPGQPQAQPTPEQISQLAQPAELDPPGNTSQSKGRGIGFWVKLCLAAFGAAAALGVLAFVLLWGPYTRKLVIEKARERGVEIDPESVSVPFDLSHARLKNTKVKLIGVSGIQATIADLNVTLVNQHPTAFDLSGVEADVTGSGATITLELSEWAGAHPQNFGTPMQASGVNLRWTPDPDAPDGQAQPWLTVKGGAVAPIAGGAQFSAENASVAGIETGKLGAKWTGEAASVEMAFGTEGTDAAPIKLTVVHTPGKQSGAYNPYAELRVAKYPLERFKGPVKIPIPAKDVFLELTARINFESEVMGGPINGNLDATLIGYSPPKPNELSDYDFGDRTQLKTKFSMGSERKVLTLAETQVLAGAFKLKGGGEVRLLEDHALILIKLLANLPCADLAASMVEKELAGLGGLGKIAGRLTKQVLKGSVGVTVAVEADSRKLEDAKVAKIIGIGCGLKPLSLPNLSDFPELGDIPLPPGMKELPKGLPTALPSSLPSGLPPLPTALPGAKDFPFPFGKPTDPPTKPSEPAKPAEPKPAEPKPAPKPAAS